MNKTEKRQRLAPSPSQTASVFPVPAPLNSSFQIKGHAKGSDDEKPTPSNNLTTQPSFDFASLPLFSTGAGQTLQKKSIDEEKEEKFDPQKYVVPGANFERIPEGPATAQELIDATDPNQPASFKQGLTINDFGAPQGVNSFDPNRVASTTNTQGILKDNGKNSRIVTSVDTELFGDPANLNAAKRKLITVLPHENRHFNLSRQVSARANREIKDRTVNEKETISQPDWHKILNHSHRVNALVQATFDGETDHGESERRRAKKWRDPGYQWSQIEKYWNMSDKKLDKLLKRIHEGEDGQDLVPTFPVVTDTERKAAGGDYVPFQITPWSA